MTLGDFIDNRNKNISEKSDNFLTNSEFGDESLIEYIKIFMNIAKGIDFIHSNENMIHRDIKPNNILFTFEDKVKISDFGLATHCKNFSNGFLLPSPISNGNKKKPLSKFDLNKSNGEKGNLDKHSYGFGIISPIQTNKNLIVIAENLNGKSLKRIENINNKLEKLAEKGQNKLTITIENDEEENENFHTKEVGTLMYSASEQMNNNYYDQKVKKDILTNRRIFIHWE